MNTLKRYTMAVLALVSVFAERTWPAPFTWQGDLASIPSATAVLRIARRRR